MSLGPCTRLFSPVITFETETRLLALSGVLHGLSSRAFASSEHCLLAKREGQGPPSQLHLGLCPQTSGLTLGEYLKHWSVLVCGSVFHPCPWGMWMLLRAMKHRGARLHSILDAIGISGTWDADTRSEEAECSLRWRPQPLFLQLRNDGIY